MRRRHRAANALTVCVPQYRLEQHLPGRGVELAASLASEDLADLGVDFGARDPDRLTADGDPGSEHWLKMMNDEQFAKRGNKKDTAWALEQVRPGWPKAPGRRRVERGKSR